MTTAMLQQASSNEQMIARRLFGHSPRTQQAYCADVRRFLALIQKPLHAVMLGDLHVYAQFSLMHLSPATQARRMASLKSLLSKAYKLGYIAFNPGAALEVGTVTLKFTLYLSQEGSSLGTSASRLVAMRGWS